MYEYHYSYLCMVIDKDADIISIADGAMCDPGPRSLSMDVDARPTEWSVCKVTVVDRDLTLLGNAETVLSDIGGVLRGIKL